MKGSNFSVLKYSFELLLKNPVLFLPKLILAVFYGVGILLSASLASQLVFFPRGIYSVDFGLVVQLLVFSILLFVISIINYFLDLFFSGLYPLLVNQAMNAKPSFLMAFNEVKPKLGKVFLSGTILLALIIIVSFVEAGLIMWFEFSLIGLLIFFLFNFLIIFFFYFLYPVVVFKRSGLFLSFKETLNSTLMNKNKVFWFSLIPFFISIIKFGLAFLAGDLFYFILFWILVLFTAFVYSLHVVVNQVLYSGLVESKAVKLPKKKK